MPTSHTLAKGTKVSLAELLRHEHVMPDPSFGISQLIKRVAEKQKARLAPRIVGNQLRFLCKCAQLYNAVVFVPTQGVWNEVEGDALSPVNLDCPAFNHRDLSISVRRKRVLPQAAKLFAQFTSDQFDDWHLKDVEVLDRARRKWWMAQD